MFELPADLVPVFFNNQQVVKAIAGMKLRVHRRRPHPFYQAPRQEMRGGNILIKVAFVGCG